MHELRILSGLHRGATLPLNEHAHTLGASEDTDVVLVDPGIAHQHATLSRMETGWLLAAGDGAIYTADSNHPQEEIILAEGDCARIGGIWITIAEEGSGWRNPPGEPASGPISLAEPDGVDANNAGGETRASSDDGAAVQDGGPGSPERHLPGIDLPGSSRGEPHAGTGIEGNVAAEPSKWRSMRLPMLFITVVSAAGIYAVTSNASRPPAQMVHRAPMTMSPPEASHIDARQATASAPIPAGPSEEELRVLFRKRLADAELIKRFDLTFEEKNWKLRATLDADETARFERILSAFIAKYNITFPVHATIGNGELMLPFKIQQVISGANASVVTDEGYRLYIGDQYRGVRVMSIKDNRLTFAGKRKIEVTW